MKFRELAKQIFKIAIQCSLVGIITIFLFEGAFRLYLIDFYKSSFEYLNSDFTSRDTDKTLMIIGDSFSSFKGGYPKVLHDSLTGFSVKNISVPGTSIREQYLFGRYHLKNVKPQVLIFQFYVGNDFLGWDHHLNWREISFARNFYWRLSESLWSLAYLNYGLGNIKANLTQPDTSTKLDWVEKPFSPDLYFVRDKLYFKSEPMLVENAAYLKGGREKDFESYMQRVADLFKYASEDCEIYFLIIPHMSQVSEMYKNQAEQVGAVFTKRFEVASPSYPLYLKLNNFFADDHRVKILNTVDLLRRSEVSGNAVYFNNDSHLNVMGQQILGEFLLKEIKPNDQ